MPRVTFTVFAALALMSAACSNDPASPGDVTNGPNGIIAGTLELTAVGGKVTLRNTTEQQVGYMVVDKEQMVVALYPPCGATCPILRQGEAASVNYAQIPGYTGRSTHAVALWWKYTVRSDGTRVADGPVQTTTVQLQ